MNVGLDNRTAAPPRPDFAAALAAFNEARDTLNAAREVLDLAQAEQAAAVNALPERRRGHPDELRAISDRLDLAGKGAAVFAARTAVTTALAVLMDAPAPDFPALVEKLKAAAEAPSSSAVRARGHLDALLADSQRLRLSLATPAGEA